MTFVLPQQNNNQPVVDQVQVAVIGSTSFVETVVQSDQAQVVASGDTVEINTIASSVSVLATEENIALEFKAPGLQGPVGEGFPPGGTTGQILIKNSNQDYDASWSSGPINQIANIENILAASGVLANKANMIDGSVVYYNGGNNEFRADNTVTLTSLTDGGNF